MQSIFIESYPILCSVTYLSLKNKISLVTGGGSGIGKAIAEKLSSMGSTVIIFDVSEQSGSSVA
ncbi:MAG: SDR family NAD(P)-dependent oxidoreductase, partial [Fervidicoccaceae archaeon]